MKISKIAAANARRIFGLCQSDGLLDEEKLRLVVSRLIETKPRDYRAILYSLQRLTRLDLDRRQVTVQSAVELDAESRRRVAAGLTHEYGSGLTIQYEIHPALLGGLLIRVGHDVLDGSVKGRLDRLADAF